MEPPASPIELEVRRVLDRLAVPYEWLPIDPSFADTAAFCARYGRPLESSANTILVASKKEPRRFAACLVAADRRLDVNHAVRRILGASKLSFATAEETVLRTGMEIGGVTPFALPLDLPILVDEDLLRFDRVILGGGGRSGKILLSPDILRRLPNARIVSDLSMPRPGGARQSSEGTPPTA